MDIAQTSSAFKALSAENNPYQDKVQPLKNDSSRASGKKEQLMADRDAYLKLLIAQLKNQNPQEPTDTTAMTQQIIAISQAEQTIQTNENLEKLLTLQQQNHRMNSVNLIGKDIEYDEAGQVLEHGKETKFQYDLPKDVDSLKIKVFNTKNELVRTIHINPSDYPELKKKGIHEVKWDGRDDADHLLPEDTYFLKIEATENIVDKEKKIVGTNPIDVPTSTKAQVIGVIEDQGEIQLLLNNGRSLAESKARIYMQAPTPKTNNSATGLDSAVKELSQQVKAEVKKTNDNKIN